MKIVWKIELGINLKKTILMAPQIQKNVTVNDVIS